MTEAQPRAARSRETRLLVVTLIVSAGMLMLLARFRFPERPHAEEVPAAPLERLAARATYEELSGILRTLDRQIAAQVIALPLGPTSEAPAVNDVEPSFVPAIRISADRAVALVDPEHAHATAADGSASAVDPARGVTVVTAPWSNVNPPIVAAPAELDAPGYLAGVEVTRNGPVVRPLYVGRVDAMPDPRWDEPLLRLSGLQQMLPDGAAIFTLDGRFVGLARPERRSLIVVPAGALQRTADRLATRGPVADAPAVTLGIEVQGLDAALRAATSADAGVIVTHVAPDGPAAGQLRIGDVIRRVGDAAAGSIAEYRAQVATLAIDAPVALEVLRGGTPASISVTPVAMTAATATPDLGLELRTVRGIGAAVVAVAPGSAAARADLRPGDIITFAAGKDGPDAAAVVRACRELAPGRQLLVGVTRESRHLVMALPAR